MNYKHFNYISRVLCVIIALILLFAFCACDTEEEYYDINNYSEDVEFCEAEKFMPNLNELGEYTDIEYLCTKNFAFFPEHTIKLIVKYSSEDYAKEKERLKTAYEYLDEPQISGSDYTMPVTSFSTEGFYIRVVKFEDTRYPKNFGMVGISNETCEIAYLWVDAGDLDVICAIDDDPNKGMINKFKYWFDLK